MSDKRKIKGDKTKALIIETAQKLFRKQGYPATSMSQLIDESGQAKGSIYFHFPGGKTEIAYAATTQSAAEISQQIKLVLELAPDLSEALELICKSFADKLTTSEFTEGCPVSPLASGLTDDDGSLRGLCGDVYDEWISLISDGLIPHGISEENSLPTATAILSSVEGAILLSLARKNITALESLPTVLVALIPK